MNKSLAAKLLSKELKKRESPPPEVLQDCFPEQLELISHPSKRKIACLTRRSGKSTTTGLYLIDQALKNPRSKSVYVNLTKEIAKKVMWTDIFEAIILKYKIPAELVGLEIRFSNGSIISLTGADASYKEKQKLRGQKNILAVVDECQSFTQDLEELILSVILPTLADRNGTLVLIGTPGDQKGKHFWWRLNDPDNLAANKLTYTYFHWSWKDNPHVRVNMQKQVQELIAANPLIEKTTKFRQEYLGEWVIEESARVYFSTNKLNYIQELPSAFFTKEAIYLLSVDLGYTDATAFVVAGYNPSLDNRLYVLESKKQSKMIISDVAKTIKEYQNKYDFASITVDAANLQAVEEMRQIHRLPLWSAEKQGKEAHIALLNSDFQTGLVKILTSTNKDLIEELETLIWSPKDLALGKHKEDPTKDNHLSDALLYAHHQSRHYWFAPKPIINPDSEDQIKQRIYQLHLQSINNHHQQLEVNYED